MGADFDARVEALDVTLFDAIPSQTTESDRASLLALQRAVRGSFGEYVYLEIGSYLGGSLQTHVQDPRCRKIYSIDKRLFDNVPDVRGSFFNYPDNSTAHMLGLLRPLAPEQLGKVVCFDADARDLNPSSLEERPHLWLIDGEHTDEAVLSDFRFCLSACRPDALIAFHDSNLVYRGIAAALRHLSDNSVRFAAYRLPDLVFFVALGDCRALEDAALAARAEDGMAYVAPAL